MDFVETFFTGNDEVKSSHRTRRDGHEIVGSGAAPMCVTLGVVAPDLCPNLPIRERRREHTATIEFI